MELRDARSQGVPQRAHIVERQHVRGHPATIGCNRLQQAKLFAKRADAIEPNRKGTEFRAEIVGQNVRRLQRLFHNRPRRTACSSEVRSQIATMAYKWPASRRSSIGSFGGAGVQIASHRM